ncbi:MAG: 2-oxo acid dehydrogenase subunit E2 [Candidatus Marinimicrobia bacterium]|nr:2-oxo acid dehydrogenase subunit E2 [Candidatus Neomarinimicrobiota bacterium]
MIVEVVMPKLGESIMEGTILEWRVAAGDPIKVDDTLLEISTDKVDSEIPSPATGTVLELLFEPQQTVDIGVVIARIGTEGEAPVKQAPPRKTAPQEAAPAAASAAPLRPGLVGTALGKLPTAPGTARFYSPLVRSMARREGLSQAELAGISGTGVNGRLTKADLLAYLETRPQAVPAPAPSGLVDEVYTLSPMRRKIAAHMRRSLDTSAHVYTISECDMTPVVAFVERHREPLLNLEGAKLTYTSLIAYATLKAIGDYPLINAALDGDNVVVRRDIQLGIAVALPDDGLIVPVVHQADGLSLVELTRSIADLAQRARKAQLQPDEAAGSTFTITNPGVYGSLMGLPIINQPNVAILAVGAVKKRPVVRETEAGDGIVIRSMMLLSLGHDHRLIDGAYGAQFLERIVHYLQTIDWAQALKT